MSITSPPGVPPASTNVLDYAARSRWPLGGLLSRVIVILIGIVVGCLIGVFIGLLTGWIEIQIVC
ncbi:MAG TPA: hypothetical protein VK797_26780 [Tepidisphaeraceae bacterium]|jgi:hypothetical protein|nr:hypothetical protein [Tepidisphaeraceae bacterium]